jgi:hypothetical protein
LGNGSGELGRNLMFHFFTIAGSLFPNGHGFIPPDSGGKVRAA